MADRDDPSGTPGDPDDWFSDDELRPPTASPRRPPKTQEAAEPAWIEDETREAAGPPAPPAGLPRWRFALLGLAAFVALVLIAFAASGLFSSDHKSTTTTATTTPEQPTTTAQTTSTTTTTTPTTPETPAVPTLPTGLLKQGTSGNEVKALQQALVAAGQSPGTVDGVFGAQTQQALIAFQQSAGIPADGVYGPATKAALEKQQNAG
jgi:hypothetical protein